MEALLNATVHTGDSVLDGVAVLVEHGRIAAVVPVAEVPAHAARRDLGNEAEGAILAPGFIDLQVNGGGGILFNDRPDVAAIAAIAAAHRRFGTTGLLPTFITDARDKRRAAVAAVRAAMDAGVPGVLGIHLEGPHIAVPRRGVHDARHIVPPDTEDLALMTGLPGRSLVTLAPETVPDDIIRALAAAGVRVAAGHTDATAERMRSAVAAGVTLVTHLFNAMSPLQGREPGAVGAALTEDAVRCGIIVDGHHVHDACIRLAHRAKPPGGLFLVTDAMPPAGAPPDSGFTLYGDSVTVRDGRCVSADGRLAGSALDMASAVRNAVRRVGIPADEALRMASTYPAAALGLAAPGTPGGRGRIAPGFAADLVLLDADFRARATWIAGNCAAC
ncbi:N-acetylglucosamine-6-phosphate deacetylase [Azospirillum halopraeferens]|uniref:N-acetylglucosamine-6-phosphate deacetylase n=1 Tax=Azospirillum halopraeferens TaxID=34010 RepID=UPI0003F550D1|nr:N-acetylglucosamine-6-phosphate deacetylase [Azospirillum halopraeferens]